MNKDILICGVGGQGTVLASKIIAASAMDEGSAVHSAETIGMAQRGGSVTSHVLRNSTPREWRRQNSPIRNRKGDNKMNKRDFNVVGNEGTDNQELEIGRAHV